MKRDQSHGWFRKKGRPSGRTTARQRSFQPRVEALEQRRLLAGIDLLQGMTFDLSAVPDQGLSGEVSFDEITYLGIAHAKIEDSVDGVPDFPDVGEAVQVDALFRATSFVSGGALMSPAFWEMTFDLRVASTVGSVDPFTGVAGFTHTQDGVLNVYVDNLMDNLNDQANTHLKKGGGYGGSGFRDGTLVATFRVRAGDGGALDGMVGLDGLAAVLDGSDDGTFELDWAMPGVFFDANGTDLSTTVLRALSDANFDMDPDNDGKPNSGAPSAWPADLGGATGGGNVMDVFALQDGSVRLGTEEENGGGEGFTPGFWKNHTDAWTGYAPTESYAAVFGVTVHEKILKAGDKNHDGELSLLETLNLKGNHVKSFYRHSVAALLNAAHSNVDYEFSEDDVKAMVTEAFATGEFESLKLILEAQNELEGDINS